MPIANCNGHFKFLLDNIVFYLNFKEYSEVQEVL